MDGQEEQVDRIWVFPTAREARAHSHIMQPDSACGFAGGVMPENGGAVASASSDNSYLPNHPGSEEVTQKTCRKTNRRSQNMEEPDGHVSGSP